VAATSGYASCSADNILSGLGHPWRSILCRRATREKQALLTTLIVAMATRNDEREHLDSERVGIIEEALVKLTSGQDREINCLI